MPSLICPPFCATVQCVDIIIEYLFNKSSTIIDSLPLCPSFSWIWSVCVLLVSLMAGFAISLNYGAGDEALLCSGSKYMRSSQSEMAGNCKVFLRNDFFGNRFAVEHLHLPRSRPRSPWLIYLSPAPCWCGSAPRVRNKCKAWKR
jgi:hypothetical protein